MVTTVGTKVEPAGALTLTSGTVNPFDANELCTLKLVGVPPPPGDQLTVAWWSPATAVARFGGSGIVAGLLLILSIHPWLTTAGASTAGSLPR
jgi:hypothetical protein